MIWKIVPEEETNIKYSILLLFREIHNKTRLQSYIYCMPTLCQIVKSILYINGLNESYNVSVYFLFLDRQTRFNDLPKVTPMAISQAQAQTQVSLQGWCYPLCKIASHFLNLMSHFAHWYVNIHTTSRIHLVLNTVTHINSLSKVHGLWTKIIPM